MKRQTRNRAALAAGAAVFAAATLTAGVSVAAPEHRTPHAGYDHSSYGNGYDRSGKSAKPAQPAKATKAQIATLFDGWNKALQTGDSQKVAARYAPGAALLPTASDQIRTTHAQIVDYFDKFLKNKPVGEKVRTVINVLDSDSAIDTGLYKFHVTDAKTGKKSTIDARYTYVYEKIGGKWLIVNHHSSVLPAAS
ncbi:SgcJ/EcaC family oxidoreductase [Streptomyces sp. NBC_01485]|uniref:SgcJ/EcaC family oxidoreductase n=1 Tax=Streptomyces sp. NBC_01485 TaxID=2903884 RepID=UPI002E327CF7|nr:SgcJ/EcaC family oxidoreductase [Streptomyces sp. NBC_01485]